jgi:peptidoglycan/LPS O-acetylase OafA/YrhL
MKRLECLDGLRGALAVYVMLGHMAPFAALPAWVIGPLSHGGAAVDVFFILSGLVIFRSLESCRFEARPFLILRVTRIFPVFLAMFAVGVALQPLGAPFSAMPWVEPSSLARDIWSQNWPAYWGVEIAAHLTMTHGLFPNFVLPDVWVSFLGAAWSLSTEWQFYVLALVLGRSRMRAERLAVVFLALAAAGLVWDLAAPEAWRFSRAFLPNKAQYFALGIASAVWADRRSIRAFTMVLGATLVLCALQSGTGLMAEAGKLTPPLLWTLCLAAQLSPHRWSIVAAPLRWRIFQWLGAISYPIYLANEPIQKALAFVLIRFVPGEPALFNAMWLPAAVLLPIAVAVWLHRHVETPALRWGRTLARGEGRYAPATIGARS